MPRWLAAHLSPFIAYHKLNSSKEEIIMQKKQRIISFILIAISLVSSVLAQQPNPPGKQQSVTTQAAGAVVGSGTPGRLSRWTGVDGSNSYTLGNSNIFEDKFGKVGIGTTTPTSLLTVQ